MSTHSPCPVGVCQPRCHPAIQLKRAASFGCEGLRGRCVLSSPPRFIPNLVSQCRPGVGQTSAQAASSDKVEGDAAEEGLEAAAGSGGAAVLPSLIASLEAQLVELKAENAAQKAQIVQLGEADVIIKVGCQ